MSQKERLRHLFTLRRGEWIPLYDILSMGIAQYNTRIRELRQEGMIIQNRIKIIYGTKTSWFRHSLPGQWEKR